MTVRRRWWRPLVASWFRPFHLLVSDWNYICISTVAASASICMQRSGSFFFLLFFFVVEQRPLLSSRRVCHSGKPFKNTKIQRWYRAKVRHQMRHWSRVWRSSWCQENPRRFCINLHNFTRGIGGHGTEAGSFSMVGRVGESGDRNFVFFLFGHTDRNRSMYCESCLRDDIESDNYLTPPTMEFATVQRSTWSTKTDGTGGAICKSGRNSNVRNKNLRSIDWQ